MTTPTLMNSGVMVKAEKSTCTQKRRYFDGKYEIIKKWQLYAVDIV